MARTTAPSGRLTREDWAAAALRSLAAGGLGAVAVEPVAASLGATKGSFYWHYKDRAALLEAALDLWERRETEQVIAGLGAVAQPGDALVSLFTMTFAEAESGRVDAALLAGREDPVVAATLERVTRRRLGYLEQQYAVAGLPVDDAARQAMLVYAAWIGLSVLRGASRDSHPLSPLLHDVAASQGFVAYVLDMLIVRNPQPGQ